MSRTVVAPVRSIPIRLRELASVRSHWYLVASAVILPLVIVALRVLLPDEDPAIEFATAPDRLGLLTTPINGLWLYAAVGALHTAGPWRHGDIGRLVLIEPRRLQLLASQILSASVITAALATTTMLLLGPLVTQTMQLRDAPTGFGPGLWPVILGTIAACTLFGVMGAAAGAALRNTAVTAVAMAAGVPLIDFVVGLLGRQATDALSPTTAVERIAGEDAMAALQPGGFATLGLWLLMSGGIAAWSTRRDIA